MRCAGPAAMLEPMAWVLAGGVAGRMRRGAVMAGANGSDTRAAVAVITSRSSIVR